MEGLKLRIGEYYTILMRRNPQNNIGNDVGSYNVHFRFKDLGFRC